MGRVNKILVLGRKCWDLFLFIGLIKLNGFGVKSLGFGLRKEINILENLLCLGIVLKCF